LWQINSRGVGATETLAVRRQLGQPKGSVLDPHADFILGMLEDKPDTTFDELVDGLPLSALSGSSGRQSGSSSTGAT
jgi:hypothetical protein